MKSHNVHIQQILELENQAISTKRIYSKRALQLILKIEEFDWNETAIRNQQRQQISQEILKLIELKLEFNVMHVGQITKDFKRLTQQSKKGLESLQSVLEEAEEFQNELVTFY